MFAFVVIDYDEAVSADVTIRVCMHLWIETDVHWPLSETFERPSEYPEYLHAFVLWWWFQP